MADFLEIPNPDPEIYIYLNWGKITSCCCLSFILFITSTGFCLTYWSKLNEMLAYIVNIAPSCYKFTIYDR